MKRLMVMLVASCTLALATGVGAAFAGLPEVPGSVPSAGSGQSQSADQQASNEASNTQGSIVAGAENTQIGGNNGTVQLGSGSTREAIVPVDGNGGGNESNGNTNTAGDQTAVNGNNFQQSNEQGISQAQTSGSSPASNGGGGGCNSGCSTNHEDQNNGSSGGQSQTAKQSGENEASNKQGAIVIEPVNNQIGLNNATIQAGSGNEHNGNTNTVGDQTAVNGNNAQQSNEQGTSQSQASSGSSSQKTDEKSCGCKAKDSKANGGQSQTAKQSGENEARNKQGAIVIGGVNNQIGLNNATLQVGSDNQSNHNSNSAGDQTAVNGNNFQQSNEQGIDQSQRSAGSDSAKKTESRSPRGGSCGCQQGSGQSQSAHQSGENEARNKQGAIVLGGVNNQIGLNNATVQIGKDNESNYNSNSAGDQTAVNGNNFQQSNEQGIDQSQRSAGSDSAKKTESRSPHGGSCGCQQSSGQSQSAHQSGENEARNKQGAFVLGGINNQIGLNNLTLQGGLDNQSNHNTNSVGDQTAVNGNNFQQSNEQGISQSQRSAGSQSPKRESCGCEQPKRESCGCEQPKRESCGCEQPKRESCGCEQPKRESCGCEQPKHESCGCEERKSSDGQSQRANQSAENEAWNKQGAFVLGGVNNQIGLNNLTLQGGLGNQSNHNTNTAGDQTAVNGNNFQQLNKQGVSQKQKSGSGRRVIPV